MRISENQRITNKNGILLQIAVIFFVLATIRRLFHVHDHSMGYHGNDLPLQENDVHNSVPSFQPQYLILCLHAFKGPLVPFSNVLCVFGSAAE